MKSCKYCKYCVNGLKHITEDYCHVDEIIEVRRAFVVCSMHRVIESGSYGIIRNIFEMDTKKQIKHEI